MRQGIGMVAAGLAVGLAASLAMTGVLRSLLFGVSPTDPLVFTAISVILGLTAALAIYIPARRTARLNPLDVAERMRTVVRSPRSAVRKNLRVRRTIEVKGVAIGWLARLCPAESSS